MKNNIFEKLERVNSLTLQMEELDFDKEDQHDLLWEERDKTEEEIVDFIINNFYTREKGLNFKRVRNYFLDNFDLIWEVETFYGREAIRYISFVTDEWTVTVCIG